MKTEFTFPFVSKRLVIENEEEIRLRVSWEQAPRKNGSQSQRQCQADAVLRIERECEKDSQVSGLIKCTVPGGPEESLPLAQMLAGDFFELLRYLGDDTVNILGVTMGKRIAENKEEEALICGRPYWMNFTIKEIPPPLRLNRSILRLYPYSKPVMHQLRQYNLAVKAPNPVDKYLALFKIIESSFAPPRGKIKVHYFVGNKELRKLIKAVVIWDTGSEERPPTSDEIDGLIKELLLVRHKCAHLRDPEISGYWPMHPEISEKVEGLADILAKIVRESIRHAFHTDCPEIAGSIAGGFHF